MWVQTGWATPCPRVSALLLLLLGTGGSTQNICSSRTDGALQAPVLYLNASSAQEGDVVLAQCVLQDQFPATRIVFCKDGLEVYSMKAQEGKVINSMLLSITERSSGTYKCFYEQRSKKNWLRSSVLSAPRDLHVTGHVSGSTEGTATADPNNQQASAVTAVASVTVILLLSAATFWTVKKGTCRERCQRQQHVPSQPTEATDYGELHYATIVHYQRDKKNGKSRDTFSSHTSHSPL
ncbi:uncharacterized protein LOC128091823 isoform X4 [Tympanuchus pallidicinctus]|uniref:uncharacterized protein LOC128091823 isoform X4 n=1 Tax=Tympanuchus pallidicinctus TaxID=109042 RepID=UPI0022875D88|nr:uncharacterized protein LOC128091823 isoform X4 [Tympanuchus pallidicinctus]XP_052561140.1 uncharacterized protein LOC128091823 isoform X4 [Tympanuchus pallidicinctus]